MDVVVLTGTGNTFASGGDLKETLSGLESDDPEMDMYPFVDNRRRRRRALLGDRHTGGVNPLHRVLGGLDDTRAAFGARATGPRLVRMERSAQYADGVFRNDAPPPDRR